MRGTGTSPRLEGERNNNPPLQRKAGKRQENTGTTSVGAVANAHNTLALFSWVLLVLH